LTFDVVIPLIHNIVFIMSTIDLTSILKSPCLPEIAATLNARLHFESIKRERFYDEMTDEQKVEFIDGEIIMHSPAMSRHLRAKLNLAILMDSYVIRHELGIVYDEKCLCVFPRNDYEPDVVFFGPEKSSTIVPRTMKFPIPDFVAEVLSDSTERRDRGVKFEDYEAHGVAEYWIIDADAEIVEQYAIVNDQFQLILKSGTGEIVSRAVAGFSIPVRAIFDAPVNLATLKNILT
jgi:Uma2 family endonuclease